MNRYLTIIVNDDKTITVEGITYTRDEMNVVSIDLEKEEETVITPFQRFQREISEWYTPQQINDLTQLFTHPYNISLTHIADALTITKFEAKRIVTIGKRCKVLKPTWNSALRVISLEVLNLFQAQACQLKNTPSKSSRSANDILNTHLKIPANQPATSKRVKKSLSK